MIVALAQLCLGVVFYIAYAIGLFFLFKKMGLEGWKGLIPFYNNYLIVERTYDTKFFWIILALSLVIQFLSWIGRIHFLVAVLVLLIILVLAVVLLVLSFRSSYFLAKSFGYDVGMAIGLFFLPFIFVYVLAFDQSVYQGNLFQNSGKQF